MRWADRDHLYYQYAAWPDSALKRYLNWRHFTGKITADELAYWLAVFCIDPSL